MRDLLTRVASFYHQPNEDRVGQVNQFVDRNIPNPVLNPLAKLAGDILFGHQIQERDLGNPDKMMGLAMGISGGMKNVVPDSPLAKRISNLLIERDTAGRLSFDGVGEAMDLGRKLLKIKPKDMKYYSADDILDNLAKKLTEDQQYAFHDLPMENMGRPPLVSNPTTVATKNYLRGGGGKFQGSLPRDTTQATKGVPLNIPKLF